MSAVNLDTGFYLVQDGVAFQWYAKREDAERALTRYSTKGWEVVPAAELIQRRRAQRGKHVAVNVEEL